METRLVRAREAAAALGIHPKTLKRWSDAGILPSATRQGPAGRRYYKVEDIERHLAAANTQEAA